MFCRQFVVSQFTRKPIQHALFHKSETNSLNSLINGKLLHKYSRQEGASERPIQNINKAKWLQFGKLGFLAASAAAGFTYWTLLDVKAGSSPGQGSGGGLDPSSGNKVKVFTKDKLKEFCEKNPEKLKLYAVSEKDAEINYVLLREVSNDEYKKLINENFDSSFKRVSETVNWISLPWWNISSKSERINDTRNKKMRQFEIFGDYKDTEKDFLNFSPVEQELKSKKNYEVRVGTVGDLTITARAESTYMNTKAKEESQDDSSPTLEIRKNKKVIKYRYVGKEYKVESVTEASSKIHELDDVIKMVPSRKRNVKCTIEKSAKNNAQQKKEQKVKRAKKSAQQKKAHTEKSANGEKRTQKKESQDDSIPTFEMRKNGNVIKNRNVATKDKVESVTEASTKNHELNDVIKRVPGKMRNGKSVMEKSAKKHAQQKKAQTEKNANGNKRKQKKVQTKKKRKQ